MNSQNPNRDREIRDFVEANQGEYWMRYEVTINGKLVYRGPNRGAAMAAFKVAATDPGKRAELAKLEGGDRETTRVVLQAK